MPPLRTYGRKGRQAPTHPDPDDKPAENAGPDRRPPALSSPEPKPGPARKRNLLDYFGAQPVRPSTAAATDSDEQDASSDSPLGSSSEPQAPPRQKRRLFISSTLRRVTKSRTEAAAGSIGPAPKPVLEQLMLSIPSAASSQESGSCPLCGMTFSRTSPDDVKIHRRYCDTLAQPRGRAGGAPAGKHGLLTLDQQATAAVLAVSSSENTVPGFIGSSEMDQGAVLCVTASAGPVLRRLATQAAMIASDEVGAVEEFLSKDTAAGTNKDLWASSETHGYHIYLLIKSTSQPLSRRTRARPERMVLATLICEPVSEFERVPVDREMFPNIVHPTIHRPITGALLIYTHPDHRRRGLASRLLDAASVSFSRKTAGVLRDPGSVAFSQLTSTGWDLAKSWVGKRSAETGAAGDPVAVEGCAGLAVNVYGSRSVGRVSGPAAASAERQQEGQLSPACRDGRTGD